MRYQGPEQRSRRVPELTAESNTVWDCPRVRANHTRQQELRAGARVEASAVRVASS